MFTLGITHSSFMNEFNSPYSWSIQHDLELLRALTVHRPIGLHAHFRILAIQQLMSKALKQFVSTESIWYRLNELYDLKLLEKLDSEHSYSSKEEVGFLENVSEIKEFELPKEWKSLMKRKGSTTHLNPTDKEIKSNTESLLNTNVSNPPMSTRSLRYPRSSLSTSSSTSPSSSFSTSTSTTFTSTSTSSTPTTSISSTPSSPSSSPTLLFTAPKKPTKSKKKVPSSSSSSSLSLPSSKSLKKSYPFSFLRSKNLKSNTLSIKKKPSLSRLKKKVLPISTFMNTSPKTMTSKHSYHASSSSSSFSSTITTTHTAAVSPLSVSKANPTGPLKSQRLRTRWSLDPRSRLKKTALSSKVHSNSQKKQKATSKASLDKEKEVNYEIEHEHDTEKAPEEVKEDLIQKDVKDTSLLFISSKSPSFDSSDILHTPSPLDFTPNVSLKPVETKEEQETRIKEQRFVHHKNAKPSSFQSPKKEKMNPLPSNLTNTTLTLELPLLPTLSSTQMILNDKLTSTPSSQSFDDPSLLNHSKSLTNSSPSSKRVFSVTSLLSNASEPNTDSINLISPEPVDSKLTKVHPSISSSSSSSFSTSLEPFTFAVKETKHKRNEEDTIEKEKEEKEEEDEDEDDNKDNDGDKKGDDNNEVEGGEDEDLENVESNALSTPIRTQYGTRSRKLTSFSSLEDPESEFRKRRRQGGV